MSPLSSSSDPWTLKEHIIPASYPRGFRRGVRDPQASHLRLHVKQYIPNDTEKTDDYSNVSAEKSITILFHHGVGCSKESYEPFFADLLAHPSCPPIRSIWSLDAANHGQSFLLNASEIGDEPHWFDTAHDVKHLINTFQAEMSAPLIGMGFSWGCNSMLVNASWHPRIFQGLICLEPAVETGWWHGFYATGIHGIIGIVRKRDRWPSREAAREAFAKNAYYGRFDARVFEKVIQYDLTDVPEAEGGGVTLTVPKCQEAAVMARPDPPLPGYPMGEEYETRQAESRLIKGFYRSEVSKSKEAMMGIHCKTLVVWSREDYRISDASYRERFTKAIGAGLVGGGGKEKGQVDELFVERGRHNFPFENPQESGAIVANWLKKAIWPAFLQEEENRSDEPVPDPKHFQVGFQQRMKEVRPMGKSSKL
jgi:pimeloyl-ACP methyl ester carboxylesterase